MVLVTCLPLVGFLATVTPGLPQGTSFANIPLDSTVHIRNAGWLLVGTYAAPDQRSPRVPAVLLLNRADGNRQVYDSLAAILARRGIASLRLDLRGHGESTNRGRFIPGAPGMPDLLRGTDTDITAGLEWLAHQPGVDSSQLGVVGASYSGEFAILSAQVDPRAHTYVLLSPGSLSSQSITWLDQRAHRWLFVASRQERSQATRDVIAGVLRTAVWADIWLWEPESHATRLLEDVPELATLLASWLAVHLPPS